MIEARHLAHEGTKRNDLRVKPEEKGPLEKPRHRWWNIKMDLREIGWEGIEYINLALNSGKWLYQLFYFHLKIQV
jgi:hypothetical protein